MFFAPPLAELRFLDTHRQVELDRRAGPKATRFNDATPRKARTRK
jgi:hypothetical protein